MTKLTTTMTSKVARVRAATLRPGAAISMTNPAGLTGDVARRILAAGAAVLIGCGTGKTNAKHDSTVNRAPTANAGLDRTASRGEIVQLDGAASVDPDGDPLTYLWTQTAGPTVVLSDPASAKPALVTPNAVGALVFSLVVSDEELSSTPDAVTVTVTANGAPLAHAGTDQVVDPGAPVHLDGSASSDPDGDALRYEWTQTSGGAITLATNGAAASFVAPASPGVITVQLVVHDGSASSVPDAVSITVAGPWEGTPSGIAARVFGPISFDLSSLSVLHAFAVEGNILFVASGSKGVYAVDVTAPRAPAELDSFDTTNALAIAVSGGHAYVADDAGKLRVLDITDPTALAEVGSYTAMGDALWVAVKGARAVVASAAATYLLDVTLPANPTLVGSTTAFHGPVALDDDSVYVLTGSQLVQLAPSSGLTQTASTTVSGSALTIAGDTAYVATANGVMRFSLAPYSITPTGGHGFGNCPAVAASDELVASGCAGGLFVDDRAAQRSGVYAAIPGLRVVSAGPTWVAMGASVGPIHIVRTAPPVPAIHEGWTIVPVVEELVVSGDRLFVAKGALGFEVYDVTDRSKPDSLATTTTHGDVTSVVVRGSLAYLASDGDAVTVVDVSDPGASVGGLSLLGVERLLSVGQHLYALIGATDLRIVRLDEPTAPALGTTLSLGADLPEVADFATTSTHLFVVGVGGLVIYDVTAATSPARVGADASVDLSAVAARDGEVFVLDDAGALRHVDTTNLAAPVIGAATGLRGSALAGTATGLLLSMEGGIAELDITVPSVPAVLAWSHAYGAVQATADAGYVYAGGGSTSSDFLVIPRLRSDVSLTPRRYTVPASTSTAYGVSWMERYPAVDEELACVVSIGSCVISEIDLTARTATLTWNLPATTDGHELVVSVGNTQYEARAIERVRVE